MSQPSSDPRIATARLTIDLDALAAGARVVHHSADTPIGVPHLGAGL